MQYVYRFIVFKSSMVLLTVDCYHMRPHTFCSLIMVWVCVLSFFVCHVCLLSSIRQILLKLWNNNPFHRIRVWMCLEDSNLITYLYFQIGGPKVLKNDLDLQWLYIVALFLSLIIYQLPNLARWYSEQKKWLLPTNNFFLSLLQFYFEILQWSSLFEN
jgi:hypothetical protein